MWGALWLMASVGAQFRLSLIDGGLLHEPQNIVTTLFSLVVGKDLLHALAAHRIILENSSNAMMVHAAAVFLVHFRLLFRQIT